MLPSRFLALTICALLASAFLHGCSQKDSARRGTVAGKVTNAGAPVSPATIRFENESLGISLAADIGPDGAYQVKTYKEVGLPPGVYKVALMAGSIRPPDNIVLAGEIATPAPAAPMIPEKFLSTETSGLQIEVKEGDNPPFDFDLSK